MAPLNSYKRETFCQLYASGQHTATAAYKAAGFQFRNNGVANGGASKLIRDAGIIARINEIQLERQAVLAQQVKEAVAEVGGLDADVMTRTGRAKELVRRRRKILEFMEARAEDLKARGVPGAATGIATMMVKQVAGKEVMTYSADVKLLAELRGHEEQIARELGQWVEKREDKFEVKSMADLPDEAIEAIIAESERVAAAAGIALEKPTEAEETVQ